MLTETTNLIPIENAIKKADQDSLVIFDIDMVLIMPIPLVIMDPYCEQLWEKIVAKNTKEQIKFLGFTPNVYSPAFALVNETLIKKCHQLNIKIIPSNMENNAAKTSIATTAKKSQIVALLLKKPTCSKSQL